jgi:ABC-type Fe3+-hydroxamate transport system substrate-binding protein
VPPPRRPGAPSKPADADRGRGRGRTIAVVAGGVLAIAVAVVVATQVLGGGSTTSTKPNVPAAATAVPTRTAASSSGTPTKATRANTTVSILNGTTVTGLAASIADKIQTAGFKRGNVQNYSDQARSASLVFYADGARRIAIDVAKILGLSADDVEAIDPDTQALAGNGAKVVVVVGNDQAQ